MLQIYAREKFKDGRKLKENPQQGYKIFRYHVRIDGVQKTQYFLYDIFVGDLLRNLELLKCHFIVLKRAKTGAVSRF